MVLAETTWRLRTLAPPRQVPVRAILGLALAAAAVAMVYSVNRGTQPRTVDVLRATHDVPVGAILQPGDVTPVSEALPDDVAQVLASGSERDRFVGHRVGQPLNAGELVSRRQLMAPARQIAPGQRVYTIPVSPEAAAGGQAVDVGDDGRGPRHGQQRPAGSGSHAHRSAACAGVSGWAAGAAYTPLGSGDPVVADSKLTSLTLLLATDADYQAVAAARWIGDLDVAVLGPGESD